MSLWSSTVYSLYDAATTICLCFHSSFLVVAACSFPRRPYYCGTGASRSTVAATTHSTYYRQHTSRILLCFEVGRRAVVLVQPVGSDAGGVLAATDEPAAYQNFTSPAVVVPATMCVHTSSLKQTATKESDVYYFQHHMVFPPVTSHTLQLLRSS